MTSSASPRGEVRYFSLSKSSATRRMLRSHCPRLEPLETRVVLSSVPHVGPLPTFSPNSYVQSVHRDRSADSVGIAARLHHSRRQGHFSGEGMSVSRNIPFPTVQGRTELLDLYRPSGPAPAGGWPVVMAIHGGGWFHFSKGPYGRRIASAFVKRGFAVVAPGYLLSQAVSPTWPINLEDVQSAVRWTRSQAGAFGLDPNRIVAMGESAGGHLAEMLGTGSTATADSGVSDRVSAVVSFSGPANLTSLFRQSPEAGVRVARFLGGPPNALPDAYNTASPVDQVRSGDPPMLLIHGAADPLVPASQSREMYSALLAAGVPSRLILIRGGVHALNFPQRYSNLIPQILAFLDQAWNHES